MGEGHDPESIDEARSMDSAGRNAQAMLAQTALLLRLSTDKQEANRSQERRSVIKITPHIQWATLGDDDQKVDRFIRIGLANDGKGMQPSEKLITLGQCLKQSRLKVYDLIVERAERSGAYAADPRRDCGSFAGIQ